MDATLVVRWRTMRLRIALLALMFVHCGSSSSASDGGADAAVETDASGGGFQPSNVKLADITAQASTAAAEDIKGSCAINTAKSGPDQDCFTSPIVAVIQPDSSTVNLIVVKSLVVEATAVIRVTGDVPLVIVSLADATISGTIDAHSAMLDTGPGGTPPSATNTAGGGAGGGPAGSGTSLVGGSGASFCGVGGAGGGNAPSSPYGAADDRPLVGGSAGGSGAVGGGSGGGAVELVAYGTLSLASGGAVTVGGEGGTEGGLNHSAGAYQNASGAGSGGAILLEAPTVVVAGTLAANGGGGGGDYASPSGADGKTSAVAASGGAGGTHDAAGGDGSAGMTIAGASGGAGATSGANAGGGGGGAGRIRINSSATPNVTGTVSPAQSTTCVSLGALRALTAGP